MKSLAPAKKNPKNKERFRIIKWKTIYPQIIKYRKNNEKKPFLKKKLKQKDRQTNEWTDGRTDR